MKKLLIVVALILTFSGCCSQGNLSSTPAQAKSYTAYATVRGVFRYSDYDIDVILEGDDGTINVVRLRVEYPPVWVGLHAVIYYEPIGTTSHDPSDTYARYEYRNMRVVRRLP